MTHTPSTPANPAQVTDARVEAAVVAYNTTSPGGLANREQMRAALTAAIGAGGQAVAEPVGYVTPDAISEVAAGRIGNHLFPKGTLRPENEIPVFTHPAPSGQAVADLTYGKKLIAEAIANHFGERDERYDEYEGDTTVQDVWEAFDALSATAHPVQQGWRPTHRHVKRGSEYMLLGIGKMQCDWWQITGSGNRYPVDMREVAIYRGEDGKLWVRPREEFEDGRFEALPAAPQPKGE